MTKRKRSATTDPLCNVCRQRHAEPAPCERCGKRHCPNGPGARNCEARAWADADPAGAVRAICTAETLRALHDAEAAADGRLRACVSYVELAVEALEGGAVLADQAAVVRLGPMGGEGAAFDFTAGSPVVVMQRLPIAGVVFAGRRLVDTLAHTAVNADGLSALAFVHRLQPKQANLKRLDPILPRITVGAVNPGRERGELLLAPAGAPGLRDSPLPLFPEVADDDVIVPILEIGETLTGGRAVSHGPGAAHELRLVFEALTALPPGGYAGGVPVAYTVNDLLQAFYKGGADSMYRSGNRPGDWAQIRAACQWIDRAGADSTRPSRLRS